MSLKFYPYPVSHDETLLRIIMGTTHPHVSLVTAAITLYHEVDPQSPYRRLACWSLLHVLSVQEQYLLKNIAKTGTAPVSGAGAAAKQMATTVGKLTKRLVALELIVDATTDADKRPRYALTDFGKDVMATDKIDTDRHVEWHIDEKLCPMELGG